MTADIAAESCRTAIYLAVTIAGPVLVAALAVGLIISFLQAATQMQDHALSFIPKLVVTTIVILLLLPWGLGRLMEYTTDVIHEIPSTFFSNSGEN
jgi:flagellar biosynthetic protein FliQ